MRLFISLISSNFGNIVGHLNVAKIIAVILATKKNLLRREGKFNYQSSSAAWLGSCINSSTELPKVDCKVNLAVWQEASWLAENTYSPNSLSDSVPAKTYFPIRHCGILGCLLFHLWSAVNFLGTVWSFSESIQGLKL